MPLGVAAAEVGADHPFVDADLGRRALGQDPAPVEYYHVVGDGENGPDHVLHEHDGDAVVAHRPDQVDDGGDVRRPQAGHQLVEEQEPGPLGQGPGQLQAPHGRHRELGHPGVGYVTGELITAIRRLLGVDRSWSVALVGVGNLGRALLGGVVDGRLALRVLERMGVAEPPTPGPTDVEELEWRQELERRKEEVAKKKDEEAVMREEVLMPDWMAGKRGKG